ncbi:helix-turn-helix transcriptional regulator [Paenibacillus gansuensis]|uniref:Helix-turn-helix transcriptional regulator n=1 Tax=Paenibacillus gansuensis TaxID=306542 RepID=A0ABW5PBY9_9BACL
MSIFRFTAPPLPHYIIGGEDTYVSGGQHPARQRISVFDLLIVTKGTLLMGEEEERWSAGPGECLLLRPDRYHFPAAPCREETHFYWLHLQTLGTWTEISPKEAPASEDGERSIVLHAELETVSSPEAQADPTPMPESYLQLESFFIYVPRHSRLREPEAAYHLIKSLLHLNGRSNAESKWKQQVLFQELLQHLGNEQQVSRLTPQHTVAELASSYLRERYRRHVAYAELAEALHFHPNYIARCMKEVYGCTPLEYVNRYRIEQAKQLLIHTDHPVGRVAEESGFSSFPFFVRVFVRHTGERPRKYRDMYRRL